VRILSVVTTRWFTQNGSSGVGQVFPLTGDTGAFWFFQPGSVEVVVKVLNGCGVNSRYWMFDGGLTDVNVILTVTDTQGPGRLRNQFAPLDVSLSEFIASRRGG
jgi:hypothetical protein